MYKDLFLATIGSIFACIGLTTGDPTQLIAAMLVSPLLNPVDHMLRHGNVAQKIAEMLILITACVVIGMLYHYVVLSHDDLKITPQLDLMTRYETLDYAHLYDVAFGVVAGICMYMVNNKSYVTDNVAIQTNVGIAIGITLLPAFVSAGILFSANDKAHKNSGKAGLLLGFIYMTSIISGYVVARSVSDYVDPRE